MASHIQFRGDTYAVWQQINPVLWIDEMGVENDTGNWKIGDGITAWKNLPYGRDGINGKSIEFVWSGTSLGVRIEGDSSYTYTQLKGETGSKGDTGPKGDTGATGSSGTDFIVGMNTDERMLSVSENFYVCDGIADDVQIQAAIDKAYSLGGGYVSILPGVYDMMKEVRLKANVHVSMSKTTTLKLRTPFETTLAADFLSGSLSMTVTDVSGFCVNQDIGIMKNETLYPATSVYKDGFATRITAINGNTLTLDTENHSVVSSDYLVSDQCVVFVHSNVLYGVEQENVVVQGGKIDGNKSSIKHKITNADADFNGIASGGCLNFRVKDCEVVNCGFQGIHPWGDHTGAVFEDCIAHDCMSQAICLDTVWDLVVRDCIAYNSGAGILAVNSGNCQIERGRYYDNSGAGVQIDGSIATKPIIASGVICEGNSEGVLINKSPFTKVKGAVLLNNDNYGVRLLNSSNCRVDDVFVLSSSIGISEEEDSDYNQFGIIQYSGCTNNYVSSSKNSNTYEMDASPVYKDVANASGSFDFPVDIKNSLFEIKALGQCKYNLLGYSGDISKNIGTYIDGTCGSGTGSTIVYLSSEHQGVSGDYVGQIMQFIAGPGSGSLTKSYHKISEYNVANNYVRISASDSNYIPTTDTTYRIFSKDSYNNDYAIGSFYPFLYGLMQVVNDKYCIDCQWGDFGGVSTIRASSFKFSTVSGRKYLVLFKSINLVGSTLVGCHILDASSGSWLKYGKVATSSNWTVGVRTFTATGSDVYAVFYAEGGYPYIRGAGYVADVVVLDLTALSLDELTDSDLLTEFSNYTYFAGTPGQHSSAGRLLVYKEASTINLMGDYGNITKHYTDYSTSGTYGPLFVWLQNLAKTVNGIKCLDLYWSDTDYVGKTYRCNRVVYTPTYGHKYLLRCSILGNYGIDCVDTSDGSVLSVKTGLNANWGLVFVIVTATDADLLFGLRGGYVTYDTAYVKDIMLFDLTYAGDNTLTEDQIYSKYSEYNYFDDSYINSDSGYYELQLPKLYAIGDTKDEIDSDGTYYKRISVNLLECIYNKVSYPLLTSGADNISSGFSIVATGITYSTSVSSTDGQIISITGSETSGELTLLTELTSVVANSNLSLGIGALLTGVSNLNVYLTLIALNASEEVLSSWDIQDLDMEALNYEYLLDKEIPSNCTKIKAGIKIIASSSGATGVLKFKNMAAVYSDNIEIFESTGGINLNFVNPDYTIDNVGYQLIGAAGPGDPVVFEKTVRFQAIVPSDGKIYVDNVPIESVLSISKIQNDLTLEALNINSVTISEDKTYITCSLLSAKDLFECVYTHSEGELAPEVICVAANNMKASSWSSAKASVSTAYDIASYKNLASKQINRLIDLIDSLESRVSSLES